MIKEPKATNVLSSEKENEYFLHPILVSFRS